MREAKARRSWIQGELAAMRAPDLSALAEPEALPLLREVARRWQASRVDVRESTLVQHRTALGRVLPVLGDRNIDTITPADVADLVAKMAREGKARETIRKSVTALAMVLDFAGISPNPARNRVQVKLPRAEPEEPEQPSADHIEAVGWLLTVPYLVALLVLDARGVRVGELESATIGDLDEERKAWLVRAAVSKTRRARWVELPDDLFQVVVERLPPREDRDPSSALFPRVTADRLRMAIGRACRDAGVPRFAPHSLRHRRISLLHHQGRSWAEIGEQVGQRSKLVTADRYTHALVDYREIDRTKLLKRVGDAHAVPAPVSSQEGREPICSRVLDQYRPLQNARECGLFVF
jgi:integrase